jgi:hypothetical protein
VVVQNVIMVSGGMGLWGGGILMLLWNVELRLMYKVDYLVQIWI